jgi:hypothetical protein
VGRGGGGGGGVAVGDVCGRSGCIQVTIVLRCCKCVANVLQMCCKCVADVWGRSGVYSGNNCIMYFFSI